MSVLSFRQSVNQLDQVAEQTAMLRRLVSHCMQTSAQYAVELKSEEVRVFRANLERLAAQAEHVSSSTEEERLRDSFRGELQTYRDGVQAEVARMRSEISGMIESMQSFMTNVGGSSKDLERVLRREFASLEATAECSDMHAIRRAIHQAAENAIRSCEEFQQAHESVTAQLQDEIRNLHKLVDHERRAALSDPVTGVWNRTKLDSRIKDLVLLNEGFCVFLAGLPSLNQISCGDARIAPQLQRALAGRLHSISGMDGELGMTGRWSDEIFAVIFNLPLSGAPATPATMQQALSGNYALQLDGNSREVSIEVRVHAVERPKDSGETAFYLQLGQAAFHATAR